MYAYDLCLFVCYICTFCKWYMNVQQIYAHDNDECWLLCSFFLRSLFHTNIFFLSMKWFFSGFFSLYSITDEEKKIPECQPYFHFFFSFARPSMEKLQMLSFCFSIFFILFLLFIVIVSCLVFVFHKWRMCVCVYVIVVFGFFLSWSRKSFSFFLPWNFFLFFSKIFFVGFFST